jgi:GNAT superfamily N-acetyltransferase
MIPAGRGDIGLLLELMAEYYACDGLRFNRALARHGLELLLEDQSLGCAWLMCDNGSTVGYLFLTFGFSLEFGGRFGLVDEVYIRPGSRGRGLGARAFGFVEEYALRLGIRAIRLEVEHENLGARNLYRRLGFNAHPRDLMTKWIAEPEPDPGTAKEEGDDGAEETKDR